MRGWEKEMGFANVGRRIDLLVPFPPSSFWGGILI